MRLSELTERLDEELRTADYADVDASANGLQVGPEETEVERVAFAVDAAEATIAAAADGDADLLVVHHGLSWGGFERVTGEHYRRIAPLIEADLPLYVSHLPLDGHPTLGNAAGICDLLDLRDCDPFGTIGPEPIGRLGRASEPYDVDELKGRLDGLDQGGRETQVLEFGPGEIESVAVVTGSGADFLEAAVEAGADALVTGEGKGKLYHQARETGIHVFLAGHYATETFGVRALADLVETWGPETTYVDHPTGL
ncbi:MAG: Nif3-like dinuclear metal center hexameric protein [Salinigranum sp.]